LYRGNFNRLLRELVHDEEFRRILGSKVPRRRMVDEELILRFFALRDGLDTYQPSLKIFLNDYMRKMQDADERILSELRAVFQLTVRRIMTTLGSSAFRLTDLKGEPTERTLNRALFDAHMLVFSWVTDDNVAGYRQNILRSLATLYEDEEFLDSIRRATGDRARTMTRVRGVAVALKRAGLNLSIPYELKAERDQRAPV
jgi:hypothetical protein